MSFSTTVVRTVQAITLVGCAVVLVGTCWSKTTGLREVSAKNSEALRRTGPRVIQGKASWYGPGFHGRRTAYGERFNRHALTLATRSLPYNTRVLVTNLRNGRRVVARVNDYGPSSRHRVADLSEGLAKRLGIRGIGFIRLEIIPQNRQDKAKIKIKDKN